MLALLKSAGKALDYDLMIKLSRQGEPDPRQRTESIVNSFPDALARPVAGAHLRLEIKDKRFGWYMEDHHGDGRLAINCKALPGVQAEMVARDPVVYHIPKYVGKKGWVGIWVDEPTVTWDQVRDLLLTAFEMSSPKPKRRSKPCESEQPSFDSSVY